MKDAWHDSGVVRALLRSASNDAPAAGAKARAMAKLGIAVGSASPKALHGAVVLAAVVLSLGWSASGRPRETGEAPRATSAEASPECGGHIEAPPCPGDDGARGIAGGSGSALGGSSGSGSWRGSSG